MKIWGNPPVLLPDVEGTFEGATLVRDLLLQQRDGVDELLGTGWAPGHVHVDGNPLVDALYDGVIVEDAAGGGAGAHGDDPLGFGHLHVELADRKSVSQGMSF